MLLRQCAFSETIVEAAQLKMGLRILWVLRDGPLKNRKCLLFNAGL
jgi:hypothetical protein